MTSAPKAIEIDVNTFRFEAERELIGTMLTLADSLAANMARSIVSEEDFHDPTMRRLFHLFGDGAKAGLSRFPLTHWIIGQLGPDALDLFDIGFTPSSLVAHCIANAGPQIGLEGMARQVRHHALNKRLQSAVTLGDTAEAERLAAEMERLSTAHLTRDAGVESVGSITERLLSDLSAAYQKGEAPRDFAPTGLHDLGRMIGGWRRKRLYVIAGRPGMGKSTLALSSLLRTALKGHGVMFFALEMGKQELSEMALASLAYRTGTRVEYRDISMANVGRDGFVQHFEAVSEVAPTFNSMPFFIDDRQGLTVAEVRSQAAQYAQRLASEGKRMDVVCIDHMGLLRASQSFGGNKVAQTEEVSNDLKRLAKELDCAVVALAQLNRSVEGRDDKRPGMADLRWSGAIEQDADVIMFPYRPEYYLRRQEEDGDKEMERQRKLTAARNKLELIIEKHRGGPTGAVELFCDVGCAVVKDLVV